MLSKIAALSVLKRLVKPKLKYQQQPSEIFQCNTNRLLMNFPRKPSSANQNVPNQRKFQLYSTNMQNWQYNEDERKKAIPKLVYLHNPLKYLQTKFNIWKLKLFWDRHFKEDEFIRGSKQAAVILTDIIRNNNHQKISHFTTPIGYQQIARDMVLSRSDARLKLVKFEMEHLRRAIPMRVARRENYGRKYCFIDMLFVGLRNVKDFDSLQELAEVNEVLREINKETVWRNNQGPQHRVIFAEIFIRFRRDYSGTVYKTTLYSPNAREDGWDVSFYKILTFDVLQYDPKPQ